MFGIEEEWASAADRQTAVAKKWAATWKAFARRCRGMMLKEFVEMQDTHRQLQGIMDRARDNPGLLLAALVLEAAKDGVELGNRASECMGWAFESYLSNHPEGPNYLEVTLEGGNHKPIYVTVQRPGGKTPHQMRMEAEAELAEVKKRNEAGAIRFEELLVELAQMQHQRDDARDELKQLKTENNPRT